MPVLLVVSRPQSDEAWWISVKDYFRDPVRQNARRIVFDKQANRLADVSKDDLLALSQAAGAGTYFRPAPRREYLTSNLLEVTRLPVRIYQGQTIESDPRELTRKLKEQVTYPPREWFPHKGMIYSVHDLRDEPWVKVCEPGTIATIETEEWSESTDPDMRRHFVWLLNDCLKSFCGRLGMRYDKDSDTNGTS